MQTTQSRTTTRPLTVLVLGAGLWLLVSGVLLGYTDAPRALAVGVGTGLVLTSLATVQLLGGRSHVLSVLMVWTGVALVLAPFALQYGYLEPVVSAMVNHVLVGLLVLVAGVLLSRRTPSER